MRGMSPASEDERPFRPTRRFEVVRRIGAGGMGIVYELVDHELGTGVAAKTLQRLSHDDIVRLKQEFRALAGLHHRNLVRLGELFEDEGCWFFTMELVDGVDVLRWVCGESPPASDASTRPLSRVEVPIPLPSASAPLTALPPPSPPAYDEERLRAALAQIAQALAYLHDAGKVHRDIKPSNILVDQDGRVVLLDFGVAADVTSPQPADGPVVGTEAFMAPEQLVARSVGPASDCYSVGVLLYRLLTGRLPDPNVRAAIRRVQLGVRLWSPRELVPAVPRDLDSLCTALLDHDAAARPTARQVVEWLGASQPRALAIADAPFVGRAVELRTLEALFAEVETSGAPVAVFVEGESGVGKSALIAEFARRVPSARALALRGRCYEHESVPYKALDEVIDLLAVTVAELHADGLLLEGAPDADLAAELFPALASIGSKQTMLPERRADPQKRRRRAFAALRRVVARLAAHKPLIVAIDDLQWTDADSMQLLAELLRGPDAPRFMLLATVRAAGDDADASTRALAERLGEVRRLPLGPLAGADAVTLATRLAAEAPAHAVDVHAIVDAAGGHPLFIDVLVRHRLERRGDGPLRLEDALRARVAALPAPARALVEHVALAGGPLLQEVAAHASELDADAFAAAAAQLRAARLCRTGGALPADLIDSYHDRVRETVVDALDGERRRGAHERLAMALERGRRGDAERIATHFREAGQPGRARRYYVDAATQARHALAFDRAARLYRLALELTPGTSELHAALGDALAQAGRGAEAADAFVAAAALARPEEAAELKRLAADQLLRSGRIDAGLALLREVFAAVGLQLPKSPRRALASLLLARARVRLRGIVFRERKPADLSASELLRIDLCWSAAVGLGIVDNIRGSGFQALNLLLSLRAGEPLRIARALGYEACFSANRGVPAHKRTARLCAAAEELAERTGDAYALAWAAASRATAAVLEGRFSDAPSSIALAESRFRDLAGSNWERTSLSRLHITALVARGRFAELQERVPAELADALERGDLFTAVNMRTGLANLAWVAADDPAGARRVVSEAMASWSQQGFFLQHYFELLALSQIDLYEGDGAGALARIHAAWPDLRHSQVLRVEYVRCLMLHLRGRAAVAAGALDEAVGAARRLEAVGEHARGRALLLRAAIAERQGDRDSALLALRSARARFDAADFRGYLFGAHHVEARLVGDAAQSAAAGAYFAAERVRNPASFVRMMLPGL
ncbi:MAG TPA: AAA family ATPase [Polyangia bacterium]|nr:AAA family ATPase [Polyangia bacterium]